MKTHLLAATALVDGAFPAPIVGQIYRTKKCEILAPATHGQTGWKVITLKDGSPVFDLVVFYGKISPGRWFTPEEQKKFKSDGAKIWWIVNGPVERAERMRRQRLLEQRMEFRGPVILQTGGGKSVELVPIW